MSFLGHSLKNIKNPVVFHHSWGLQGTQKSVNPQLAGPSRARVYSLSFVLRLAASRATSITLECVLSVIHWGNTHPMLVQEAVVLGVTCTHVSLAAGVAGRSHAPMLAWAEAWPKSIQSRPTSGSDFGPTLGQLEADLIRLGADLGPTWG